MSSLWLCCSCHPSDHNVRSHVFVWGGVLFGVSHGSCDRCHQVDHCYRCDAPRVSTEEVSQSFESIPPKCS